MADLLPAQVVSDVVFWLMAPIVIALRVPRLAKEASGIAQGRWPEKRTESERMVTENLAALQLGLVGAHSESARLAMGWHVAMATGRPMAAFGISGSAFQKIAAASARPAEKAVRSNIRRLRSGAR